MLIVSFSPDLSKMILVIERKCLYSQFHSFMIESKNKKNIKKYKNEISYVYPQKIAFIYVFDRNRYKNEKKYKKEEKKIVITITS